MKPCSSCSARKATRQSLPELLPTGRRAGHVDSASSNLALVMTLPGPSQNLTVRTSTVVRSWLMKHAKNPAVAEPFVVVDGDSLEDVVGVMAAAAGATKLLPWSMILACTFRADT